MFNFDIDGIVQDCTPEFSLAAPAAAGLSALLGFLAEDPDVADVRWAAYMLATVRRECANKWVPLEEFGKEKGMLTAYPSPSPLLTALLLPIPTMAEATCS